MCGKLESWLSSTAQLYEGGHWISPKKLTCQKIKGPGFLTSEFQAHFWAGKYLESR